MCKSHRCPFEIEPIGRRSGQGMGVEVRNARAARIITLERIREGLDGRHPNNTGIEALIAPLLPGVEDQVE